MISLTIFPYEYWSDRTSLIWTRLSIFWTKFIFILSVQKRDLKISIDICLFNEYLCICKTNYVNWELQWCFAQLCMGRWLAPPYHLPSDASLVLKFCRGVLINCHIYGGVNSNSHVQNARKVYYYAYHGVTKYIHFAYSRIS